MISLELNLFSYICDAYYFSLFFDAFVNPRTLVKLYVEVHYICLFYISFDILWVKLAVKTSLIHFRRKSYCVNRLNIYFKIIKIKKKNEIKNLLVLNFHFLVWRRFYLSNFCQFFQAICLKFQYLKQNRQHLKTNSH